MVAKVMRQHSPEKKTEKEQYDGADQDGQPKINQEFHF
jgi:hypothetical protein